MAHVMVLGAGLGGIIMAYEFRDEPAKQHRVSVVSQGSKFHFVPSNPWLGVGWRDKRAVEVDLDPVLKSRGICFHPQGAKRLNPAKKGLELVEDTSLSHENSTFGQGAIRSFL